MEIDRAWLLIAVLASASIARADGKPPCKACTLELPPGAVRSKAGSSQPDGKRPLLVVLHGDREQASTAAARWRDAARQRSWALLSLQCPSELGCRGSWWQWNGNPSWIFDRVSDIAQNTQIDNRRIYLVGWSGGATYIGLHAAEWNTTFAALVIHGGGMPPLEAPTPGASSDEECLAHVPPVYALVGDRNPLHYLVKRLRSYLIQCHVDIEWDLVRGGDHDKEDRALDRKKALAILDWLAERRLSIME